MTENQLLKPLNGNGSRRAVLTNSYFPYKNGDGHEYIKVIPISGKLESVCGGKIERWSNGWVFDFEKNEAYYEDSECPNSLKFRIFSYENGNGKK